MVRVRSQRAYPIITALIIVSCVAFTAVSFQQYGEEQEQTELYGQMQMTDLARVNTLIPIDPIPAYHLKSLHGSASSVICNRSYFALVWSSNMTTLGMENVRDLLLLEVAFGPAFSTIERIELHPTPLNVNRTYRGLAYDGRHFLTLEDSDEPVVIHGAILVYVQNLVSFSLDGELVCNRTFPHPDLIAAEKGFPRSRVTVSYSENRIITSETTYLNETDSGVATTYSTNVSVFNAETFERIRTFSVPPYQREASLSQDGLIWLHYRWDTVSGLGRETLIGYSVHTGLLQRSILASSRNLWDGSSMDWVYVYNDTVGYPTGVAHLVEGDVVVVAIQVDFPRPLHRRIVAFAVVSLPEAENNEGLWIASTIVGGAVTCVVAVFLFRDMVLLIRQKRADERMKAPESGS